MILIIGGAYQGKLAYALERTGKTENDVHFCSSGEPSVDFSKDILYNFHLLILAQIRNGIDARSFIEKNLGLLQNKIIICDDISCGVVPTDPEQRQWREATGHSLGLISRHSHEVIRIFCGLESKLK